MLRDSDNHPLNVESSTGRLPLYLVATGADRQIRLRHITAIAGRNNEDDEIDDQIVTLSGLSDSPILSYVSVRGGGYIFMTNMSGQILLVKGSDILDSRRDHKKYVVKVIAHEESVEGGGGGGVSGGIWIATAGWDGKIFVYHVDTDSGRIGEPVGFIDVPTNPESLVFTKHPESRRLILIVSRRDSSHLHYYRIEPLDDFPEQTQLQESESPSPNPNPTLKKPCECQLLGRQNLAPHSIAWVTFSPSAMAISPHDPTLLAVATSTTPHMKVIIVRLMFPADDHHNSSQWQQQEQQWHESHFSQAMAALSLQNREDAAILVQTNTFAPQTAYSVPQVVWRPDGSGLWVNGDDGVIRGVETKTGKVTSSLKDGHQPGSKVRTIWAGWVDVLHNETILREEWLVSGGFDKRLIVWRI